MRKGIVVLNGGETWDPEELVKKYPITNTESWELLYPTKLTKGKHSFLVSKIMFPSKDPWNRSMKRWSFAALPIGKSFSWVQGYDPLPPIPEDKTVDEPLGYTTIEGRTVKLWRRHRI
jgi:hypothetical protein